MKSYWSMAGSVVIAVGILSSCTNGDPEKIDKATLPPIAGFVISPENCAAFDPFITAKIDNGVCVIRLDREAYSRVDGEGETCDGLDLSAKENYDDKSIVWVVKIKKSDFTIFPRTKSDPVMQQPESEGQVTPGVYFTTTLPGENKACGK